MASGRLSADLHADDKTEPQAVPLAVGRRPLNLPPPARAADTTFDGPPSNGLSADDRAAGVAAALSAMHAAAAAATLSKPSAERAGSSSRKETVALTGRSSTAQLDQPSEDPLNPDPLPPVHTLPTPITRAAVSAFLRDHLSAPLGESDPIRDCDPPILKTLQASPSEAMSVAHEKIHVFPFKDVQKCWLRAWVEGSLWRAVEVFETEAEDGDWVADVVRVVDMALILAGGVGREAVCAWIFEVLERILEDQATDENIEPPSKRRKLSSEANEEGEPSIFAWSIPETFPSSTIPAPPLSHEIPRHANLSLDAFQAHLNTATDPQNSKLDDLPGDLPEPIIITGALNHWPALSDGSRRWSNPHHLMRKTLGGRRLVPVEIGRSYTDEGWGQGIITFREFMQKYMFHDATKRIRDGSNALAERVATSRAEGEEKDDDDDDDDDDDKNDDNESTISTTANQTGYLAQHDLFAQVPSLRADIAIPDYCYATPVPSPSPTTKNTTPPLPPGHPSFPLLNAWFGPAGTISPLHTDPYHNILVQVVGSKYVRLYPPGERENLYPRGVGEDGVDMGNTSEIDIGEAMEVLEGWDWTSPQPSSSSSSFSSSSSSTTIVSAGREMSKAEAWAREEDLKMRRFDFEERFPRFRGVNGCKEAVLGPGECLYVPKGWWHYVRSLAPSFSVSFWWD